MTREILHIGFMKTGTTALQRHFFAKHPEIMNIGKPYADLAIGTMLQTISIEDDAYYPREKIEELLKCYRAKKPHTLLFSEEKLTNTPLKKIAAKRLKELFPEARILVTIRNQFDSIKSYYAQKGRTLDGPEPYAFRHVSIENYIKYCMKKRPRHNFLGTVDYNTTVEFYETLFGKQRIFVFLYEEFLNDSARFIARLAEVLDVDIDRARQAMAGQHENIRRSEGVAKYQALRSNFLWGVPLSRYIPGSRLIKETLINALGRNRLEAEIPGDLQLQLAELYRPGNRALRERFDLPLDRFGYPL